MEYTVAIFNNSLEYNRNWMGSTGTYFKSNGDTILLGGNRSRNILGVIEF